MSPRGGVGSLRAPCGAKTLLLLQSFDAAELCDQASELLAKPKSFADRPKEARAPRGHTGRVPTRRVPLWPNGMIAWA
eukprot:6238371-Prymnesium_polylepis.1